MDNITATFKKIKNSKVKIEITIDKEKIEEYKNMTLRHVGENIQLGGFRKGKAPLHIVRENIDRQKFLLELIDLSINQSYFFVIQKYKDDYLPIGSPKIDFVDKIEWDSLEKGLKYVAEVDIYPDIELYDYSRMKIKERKLEINSDEINRLLDDLRKKRSTLQEVDGEYCAKDGDWLDVSFEVLADGKIVKNASVQHFPLVLGDKSMIPGFELQLNGLNKNKKKSFELVMPVDFRDKNLANKKVQFNVEINDIKKVIFPDLNDEFAVSMHIKNVNSFEELKKYLENNLKKEKEQKNISDIHNEIIEKIATESNFELPESLVDRELHAMWHEYEDGIKGKGIEFDDYLKKQGLTKENIINSWKDQAEKRVKIGLVIAELIKKEKITVEDREIDEEIENELKLIKDSLDDNPEQNNGKLYNQYVEYYKKMEIRDKFRENVLIKKLFTILDKNILK